MNTIDLKIEELNSSELQQIDGGIAPVIIYCGCLIVGGLIGAGIRYYATR